MDKRTASAHVREISKDVDETRTIDFIISDSTKDRHSTVVNQNGWKLENYLRNPVVGYQHNIYGAGMCTDPNPDMVIGKAANVRLESGKLMASVVFEPAEINELAEKIFKKLKFGSLKAVSVGFVEIGEGRYGEGDEARGAKSETYYFSGQELLEFSVVNIPSNPSAVARSPHKIPTVEECLNTFNEFAKDYPEADLRKLDVVTFLKATQGIEPLTIPRKNVETNNLSTFEKRLRLLKQTN